jgi:hypothetical protein
VELYFLSRQRDAPVFGGLSYIPERRQIIDRSKIIWVAAEELLLA